MEELKEIMSLLEKIKEHQLNYVQLARTTEPYKLADKALNIALSINAVMQAKPEFCDKCSQRNYIEEMMREDEKDGLYD